MHSFLSNSPGRAGLTDPPITGRMFWLRLCCRPFACTHIANTDLCPHELRGPSVKENRGDLRLTSRLWARWPHILNGHCSVIDWLSCAVFLPGYTGVPETANANGHQSPCVWSRSKFCYFTMPKLPSEGFLGQQQQQQKQKKNSETISEHQRFINFPWGAYLQTPLA